MSLFNELAKNIVLILDNSLSDLANFLSKNGTKADVQPLQIITLGNQNKFGSILIVARE